MESGASGHMDWDKAWLPSDRQQNRGAPSKQHQPSACVVCFRMLRMGWGHTLGDVRGAVDKDSDAVRVRPVLVIQVDPGVDHEAPLATSKLNLHCRPNCCDASCSKGASYSILNR